MREIEFRAFHKGVMLHNCAVINGSLAIEENPKGDNLHVTDDGRHYHNDWAKYVIYPDSKLMQYTGFKDASGKTKIFEGDIVRWGENIETVSYDDDAMFGTETSMIDKCMVVIGNIYENPELLTTEDSLWAK
jgi:hypothetical protein